MQANVEYIDFEDEDEDHHDHDHTDFDEVWLGRMMSLKRLFEHVDIRFHEKMKWQTYKVIWKFLARFEHEPDFDLHEMECTLSFWAPGIGYENSGLDLEEIDEKLKDLESISDDNLWKEVIRRVIPGPDSSESEEDEEPLPEDDMIEAYLSYLNHDPSDE